ncbi:MAG TPA: hypothetical protein VL093_04070 [Flavipsychrobacter sp.]|nr:hypothetical protein [Flavipsychrobacter sp.]
MTVNFHKVVSKSKKKISGVLLTVMLSELLLPLRALALTSGPSQPEFQGFTPLATTSLVDPFSGDFSYNIPLLDIDGYPLNLVYRATSNIEEEGSWVGYGWNVNVGTLNRMVRGLPDDMKGGLIKSYQNIKERTVKSIGVSFEPSFGVHVGTEGVGLAAGVQSSLGFTFDDDNYIGKGIGLSIGGGVYANVNAGPFSVGASAGVTLSANSNTGGTISTYAGFNAGLSYGEYFSVGLGTSVNRSFNTISGWEHPNVVGSFNIGNVTREVQKSFISSISNEIPQITNPYRYTSNGLGFKLTAGFSIGIIEELGLDFGIGVAVTENHSSTTYNPKNIHKGYGYIYSENASPVDIVDFTRDNDGGLNKDMPFLPPAMKTYDVFSSTAHNATNVFRADRNDFGVVRDPQVEFPNTDMHNKMHQLDIHGYCSFTCWIGLSIEYNNFKTTTEGTVASGGCVDDRLPYRPSNGKDQNLFFKACGATSQADDNYISQVNGYGMYGLNKSDSIKGITPLKRELTPEPIAVYTNQSIADLPQTVIPKQLISYKKDSFPSNRNSIKVPINRVSTSDDVENSKIGAILNTNRSGQTYMYATPVVNNIKNEVGFRINGFIDSGFHEREGTMSFEGSMASQYNGEVRDNLYKNTLTPSYATSYLLNAVLSPDYVDVTNDGITDDDLGSFVKFNYTKCEDDYRWRVPYADSGQNLALLNQGVKITKFDDMGSYMIGSKKTWYAHSIESKNYVVEFYISDREDALDSRSRVMRSDHPYAVSDYVNNKDSFAHMQKLDSIKYYYKHDRYLNGNAAVPLKTIYFDYDYGISSNMPNSVNHGGKLRLLKVRVRHGDEPIEFAEAYNLGYTSYNPGYSIGDKDGWGNYYPNNRSLPLCEFPYIDQENRQAKDSIASAFHLNMIGLPSGGEIDVAYEADDYAWVQNKRAMALTEVAGVGSTPNVVPSDVFGLYDGGLNSYLYIYVKKPVSLSGSNYKSFLLNNSDLMYFSFNINIAGNAFSKYDQVKGYASVDQIGDCPNDNSYIYIKVRPVDLTGTGVSPSPMTNTAINMARAFATDQLYFQENENSDGKNRHQGERLKKAALQVAEAILGQNSVKKLMKRYGAGRRFNKNKSYVRIAMTEPKIGGGSRVSRLTFDDEWNQMSSGESSSLIGYNYIYKDENGLSSGVASYEPTLGGEENPLRSGSSYALSNNHSNYPPYDPVELVKEDPAGESFFPTGSVGYSRIVIESIHKGYARSAQSKLVQEFYTAKDFPFFSTFSPKVVSEIKDKNYPNPGIREILLSFLGVGNTFSSSENKYDVRQNFIIETNDMHGKPKASYTYRLLPKNGKEELVSSTEYFYHSNGYNKLSNEVDVIRYQGANATLCQERDKDFPKANLKVQKKTLGVDIDVCSDSREVTSIETTHKSKRGGGIKFCLPPQIKPKFSWVDDEHKHTDYFKATTTTKIINRYGILKSVRNYKEGAETVVENKYYDAVTGEPVVQVVKDEFGDNIYSTNVPAYWTKTDLEPSYMDYPFWGTGSASGLPSTLHFGSPAGGFLYGSSLIQASFVTSEDNFHQGDEIFVRASSTDDANVKWHRLYVVDVLVKKSHFGDPDPLSMRYGSAQSSGASYMVYVTPYKVNNLTLGDLGSGDELQHIEAMFRYRSGRKNMLDLSAGKYESLKDPFVITDSIVTGFGRSDRDTCKTPSFMKPVINAVASRYEGINSLPSGQLDSLVYNPVSVGIVSQPYISTTYGLFGDRKDQSTTMQQRGNGVLYNWYYWQPARVDTSPTYLPRTALLTHYDNYNYNSKSSGYDPVTGLNNNATWFTASQVTKSIPSVGPVEETNPLGIYSSIFVEPTTKKLMSATANGKFGQTWVETFENLQEIRKYNSITDLIFSPFQKYMTRSGSTAANYEVFNKNQTLGLANLNGSFTLDNTQSHTGLFSLHVTSATSVKLTPKKYSGTNSYFFNLFNFNLDTVNSQKFTYEVWVKNTGGSITSPSINSAGTTTTLAKVSNTIDGWVLYRANVTVNDNSQVTFTFPQGQYYDDLRVFPSTSNVKTYVYHPFKTYLMAILDENDYATFYEYNNRNQLVRLKKETEKGVITITENIKNIIVK